VQFFCELNCPNRREFFRKFFEFASRAIGIRGDFSPAQRNRASDFAEKLLVDAAVATCRAAP